ncbi:hypothetical protein EYZ11_005362 [Aspergillus tanneri]|uniref:ABC transporter domain-containing protein n=1 Tax=Aspergillus tanneri TaxID=1220188 RepID=A0A4S3JI40_9EURO|nr:hypothetical protein EYZ11_005362 [Aspergillus tanneri]
MFVQGFCYGSSLAISKGLSAGDVLRTFWACLAAAQSIELSLPQVIVLEKGKVAAVALKKVLETKVEDTEEMKGTLYPHYCEGDIEVNNLSFFYPLRPDRPSLESASLFFPAGNTTFVIGQSGSGKSTLGQLLARFYLPTSGDIFVGGVPIRALDINWIRNNVTLVEQRSVLFNESIFMNIALGRRDYNQIKKADIQECIDLSALQNVTDNMTNGINTCVGYGGNLLSGGERQRVAIARARLRDTPVLILDEPTSALDSTNCVEVIRSIRKWREGKTTIIITHDLTQILDQDFVYILEQGSVAQAGYRYELRKIPGNERLFPPNNQDSTLVKASRPQVNKISGKAPIICSDNSPLSTIDDQNGADISIALGDGIVSYSMCYLLELCGQVWVDGLRKRAFQLVLDQPKTWFEEEWHSPAHITSCIVHDGEEMRNIVSRFAGFVLVAIAISLIATTWSMAVCWRLTVVALACGPIVYAITRGFEGTSGLWEKRCNEANSIASEALFETFSEIRTVRSLTLESFFHKKYLFAASKCVTVGLRKAVYTGFVFGLVETTIIFVSALIFYYGAVLVASAGVTVSSILTVFSMLLFSIGYASTVLSWIPQISTSKEVGGRLLRFANLPEGESHEHRDFRYPSRPEACALRRVTITIPDGSCTAIVGCSGSGKSTLASLLLSLYETPLSRDGTPTISLGGVDIRHLHTPTLRSLVAIVSQQPTLFSGTIEANIRYGLERESPRGALRNVRAAAEAAGIDDFVTSLSKGYFTVIGDGGIGLSGGQAQRLVIARALIRQPQMLILDEATSSLDPTSAKVIRQTVQKLVSAQLGLTVIIITHAREMMEIADNIVVLDQGRVIDEGPYDRLAARPGGHLKALIKAQDRVI